jgi:O-succinylbenzoic acid--CoA ligase
MHCPIFVTAQQLPDYKALITDEESFTYRELDRLIAKFADALKKKGIQKDSKVAFIASFSWQTVVLFFALFRLKAIACPLSFRAPEEQIKKQLLQLKVDFFLQPEQFVPSETEDPEREIDPNRIAILISTSGTSSSAKMAALSFFNLYYSARGSTQKFPLLSGDHYLLSLPLFHVGGLSTIFRCFLFGLACVISERPLVEAIIEHKIHFLSCVPTQLFRICQSDEPVPHLKGILLGGAATSGTLFKLANKKGLKIFTSYGLTEMSSQVTLALFPCIDGVHLSSGFPLPHRNVKIAEDGEIHVKGDTLFLGYLQNDELHLPVDSQGWFATRDRGKWSEEGELIVLGRKDNLFISGGENVFPEEIESALLSLPEILDALVVPISDPEFGERPVAFVEAVSSISEDSLNKALRKILPGFKIPRRFLPFPEEPDFKQSRTSLRKFAETFFHT